jgi:peptidoglycan/xylan/chitin deacetylase (PgdA/CDA1 family)
MADILRISWSHANLVNLDAAGITSEMTQLEDALLTILGYFPAYMRPPFLSTSDAVLQVLSQLQYHVIEVDIDTEDWENLSPTLIQNSAAIYQQGIANGGTISLSHDPLNNTANALVQEMMDYLTSKGLTCKYIVCPHIMTSIAYIF